MHITGERRIPAPRERVWRSLSDPAVLQGCVAGIRVEAAPGPDGAAPGPAGAASMLVSGFGHAPLTLQPSIREPFATMGWKVDPAGAATQRVLIRLAEEGVFTRLHYELSLADAQDTAADTREANLRARIDQAIDRLVQTIAGPAEIGASGVAGAVQAATDPSAQPNARIGAATRGSDVMTRLMTPSVIGGALFLMVLLFIVGLL